MKRIITCSDGTWNKPGCTDRGIRVYTNVEKIFNAICDRDEDIRQLKVYDQGVGTGFTFKDRLWGGAAGAGIDKNIKDMYLFLMLNYQPGDELYLFGFSRGAYTARSLAGFIRCCGLLKLENIDLVDKAYELYRDRNDYSDPSSDLMVSFRKCHSVEDITPIKFLGVWDTVGALGIPLSLYRQANKSRYKFHDVTLSSTVQQAYQALGIDEKRFLFQPTLWEKSPRAIQNPDNKQQLEQRWFAGVHSNIGGGYAHTGLSDITLNWMVKKAQDVGLCFYDHEIEKINGDSSGELRNSVTSIYRLLPSKLREINLHKPGTNQVIDPSVWERYKADKGYRPGNLKPPMK